MITKHDLLMRIINLEDMIHETELNIKRLDRQVKKLTKPQKDK